MAEQKLVCRGDEVYALIFKRRRWDGRPAYVSQNTTSSSRPSLIRTCEGRFPESDIILKQLKTPARQPETHLTRTGPHVMFAVMVTFTLSATPRMRVILHRITCSAHVNEGFHEIVE